MFIDGDTLMIAAEEIFSGADLVVAQIGNKTILSETDKFQCP
jgi:SOS-response transcriptional repressor LexA